ncbi:MAG: hypothetical protein GYA45_11595 [Pelolinea sp.]|nr:hypothetical protein [Pelolinea sp.]
MTTDFGLRYWFNDVQRLWSSIVDDKGQKVLAFTLEKMPESVTKVPCALSFIVGNVSAAPSVGGPSMVIYNGKTEFHLTQNLGRQQLPYVMSFIDKIIQKAASSITLNGKVVSFRLATPGSIAPVTLVWGQEEEHYGLEVFWQVIENQSGKYTVSP